MASAFEWLDTNGRISYPFEDSLDGGLNGIFVDAYVACVTPLKDCRIRLSLFDSIAQHVILLYEDDSVMYDLQAPANCTYSSYDFGPEYRVHEWRRLDSDDDVVVRFTTNKNLLSGMEPIAVAGMWMLRTLIDQRAPLIRRLGMKLPGIPCCTGGGLEEGYFILRAGYNISMSVASVTSGVRDRTVIALDAVPGAGLGQYPGCGLGDEGLRSIGNQVPDAFGNLVLDGDNCMWVERPLDSPGYAPPPGKPVDYEALVTENTLKLHDNCDACCDCADYGAAYQALRDTWLRLVNIARSVEISRSRYNELVAATNIAFCAQGFIVTMRCVERPDYMASVVITVANRSDQPLHGSTIQMSATPDYGSYLPNSGLLESSQPGGAPAKIKQDLSPIKAMKYPVQEDVTIDPLPDVPEEGITGMSITLPVIPAGGMLRFYFDIRFMAGIEELIKSFDGYIIHDSQKAGGTYTAVGGYGQAFTDIQPGDMFRTFYVGDDYTTYPIGEITGLGDTILSLDSGPGAPIMVPIPMRIYRDVRIGLSSTLTAKVTTSLGSVDVFDTVTLEAPKGKV